MYIKSYKKFLEDLDISKTYLPQKKRNPDKYSPFFGAQSTADKSWGLEFSGDSSFQIIFPEGFEKYFAPKGSDPDKWLLEDSGEKTDDGKIMTNQEKYKILLDEVNSINRETSPDSYNRIHFPQGIPPELRSIGFGYIIYEELIKHLGYASSRSDASSDAKPVWSKIANDPDFWIIMFDKLIFAGYKKAKNLEEVKERIYDLIQKKLDLSGIKFNQETNYILIEERDENKAMIKWLEKTLRGFKMSPELLEDVPEIKDLVKVKFEKVLPQKKLLDSHVRFLNVFENIIDEWCLQVAMGKRRDEEAWSGENPPLLKELIDAIKFYYENKNEIIELEKQIYKVIPDYFNPKGNKVFTNNVKNNFVKVIILGLHSLVKCMYGQMDEDISIKDRYETLKKLMNSKYGKWEKEVLDSLQSEEKDLLDEYSTALRFFRTPSQTIINLESHI